MKGTRNFMDIGNIFDAIFGAAEEFKDKFKDEFKDELNSKFNNCNPNEINFNQGPFQFTKMFFDDSTDYYPNYLYPPMNVLVTENRTLVFEFALAGFDEKDINLSFQGDYMVFFAKISQTENFADDAIKLNTEENVHYLKRRLKLKDIEKQKYFVPLDKYAQEKVKAVFKNGILRVCIPPKEEPDHSDGIKIEIVKDANQ